LNRGIRVLQTLALPLGYVTIPVATRIRLELTTSSVTGWRSNQLNYRAIMATYFAR
jgi:hypothetical protein